LLLAVVAALLAGTSLQAASLSLGADVNVTRSQANNAETTIAINPLDPNNLFVDDTLTTVGMYSTNGGTSWYASDLSALPRSIGDVSTAWDAFGNLFLVEMDYVSRVVVGLSTNGGASFIRLYVTPDGNNDQPTVAAGPGRVAGHGSVWFCYTGAGLEAQGADVVGLGQVGAFGAPQMAAGGQDGDFGDIAIGPNGEVVVVYQSSSSVEGPDTLSINVDPDGLGPAGFGPMVIAANVQVGAFASIPAQPQRKIDAEAGLAWDRSSGPRHGRMYLMYTDRPSINSYDTDIYVSYSDDGGTNWSARVRVNDDAVGNGKSQFLPRIAIDQTSGNIAVSFYDCRNSIDNNTVEVWATASVDGGVTFLPNVKVSGGVSSALSSVVHDTGFDFGDYTGLAFEGGAFYPCWADNSNSTGDNPTGALGYFDTYTARVTLANLLPPRIVMAGIVGTNFTFSFQSTGGQTYLVQYKDEFSDPLWGDLQSVVGDGFVLTISSPVVVPQRFYRLAVQ
jgi:hypothetical protein